MLRGKRGSCGVVGPRFDRKQADDLGLEGTPMIYINGRYFSLENFDLRQDLEPWVALEIELVTGKPAAKTN